MRQYRVWRDDSGGFIAIDVDHPFCQMLAEPMFAGTEEEIWGMSDRRGRHVAFLRARGHLELRRP